VFYGQHGNGAHLVADELKMVIKARDMSDLKLTWDDLRERARNHTDLSQEKKRLAAQAFDTLQGIFGTTFFDNKHHPLFFFFFDGSSWRCEWAIWFAHLLKSLRQHADFPNLVRDLKNPDFYDERMSVLKIIEVLIPLGFSFRLDDQVSINGDQKKPDLFVKLNASDPGLFIEVTRLGRSKKQQEADAVFDELWGRFFITCPLLEWAGRLERPLAPLHLQEIKQQIQSVVKKAENETGFETLEIAGVVQFACAMESHTEKLQKWATARGMKAGELSGPSVNIDEFDRISSKLKDKIKQVPSDRANVIVLYPHLFTMPPRETGEFAAIVHALEDLVYKHSHIGYLVLIFSWTGGNENTVIRYRDHICVNRLWLYFNCNSIMLIKNRFATKPMPPEVEASFLKAFVQSSEKSLELNS
jgi:hypothetical protein